ncbi:MAG: membrane-associated protein [Candidatus Binatia bacterium]
MIPLWLKISYTLFVAVLAPVYWTRYGPANFLWFSDIALLLTVPALWLENSWLASTMAVSVLLLELAWSFEFLARLLTGANLTSLSGYMFDKRIPLYLRGLSLFHLVLPPLLFYLVWRLSYDGRALLTQTLLSWVVVPASYWASDAQQNVNWVYGFGAPPQKWLPAPLHVASLMLGLPLLVYLPTHLVLKKLFG